MTNDQNGQEPGALLFRRQKAVLEWVGFDLGNGTRYTLSWWEDGPPRLAEGGGPLSVVVTVRERTPLQQEDRD